MRIFKSRPSILKGQALLRVAIYAVVSLLVAGLAWYYFGNGWETLASAVALSVLFEGVFFHRRFLLSIIASVLHLLTTSFMAFFLNAVATANMQPATGQLHALQTVAAGLFIVAIAVYLIRTFARGRIWLNLIFAYILYNAAFIAALVGLQLPILVSFGIGLAVMGAYITIRSVRFSKKKTRDELKVIDRFRWKQVENPARTAMGTRINKALTQERISTEDGVAFYPHRGGIVAIFPLAPRKELIIENGTATLDGADISKVFEHVAVTTAGFAQDKKLPARLFTSVIVVKDTSEERLSSVKVPDPASVDRSLGTVFLISEKLFPTFMNTISRPGKKLSKRVTRKLEVAA